MFENDNRCCLTLIPKGEGKPFDLIIYGRTAAELMTVPNEVVQSIARRYPDYTSSIFLLKDYSSADRRDRC